jgi:hypothetical protein
MDHVRRCEYRIQRRKTLRRAAWFVESDRPAAYCPETDQVDITIGLYLRVRVSGLEKTLHMPYGTGRGSEPGRR